MSERWVPVPTWEGRYEVSDWGRVRSADRYVPARGGSVALRRGRILVQVPKQGRYLAVTLAEGDRRKQYLVHELVLLAFRGPPPKGQICRHWDDDKGNNAYSNLLYGTPQDNSDDKKRNGNSMCGEKHHQAVLTASDVLAIRASGAKGTDLAAQYGVTPAHISSIRKRKTWKHI